MWNGQSLTDSDEHGGRVCNTERPACQPFRQVFPCKPLHGEIEDSLSFLPMRNIPDDSTVFQL